MCFQNCCEHFPPFLSISLSISIFLPMTKRQTISFFFFFLFFFFFFFFFFPFGYQSELEACQALRLQYGDLSAGDSMNVDGSAGQPFQPAPHTDQYWPSQLLSRREEGHKRLTLLRALFKFLLHAWMATGTADRMRPLIDSSLPQSIMTVVSNYPSYGPGVYATATFLLATIIHNEPTYLNTLQEMGLQAAFFDHFDQSIGPHDEVLSALPGLLSAFCLNNNGLNAFLGSGVLVSFLRIFCLPQYLPVFSGEDLPDLLGTAADELIRHQPDAREHIFGGIRTVLEEIRQLGQNPDSEAQATRLQFQLLQTPENTAGGAMEVDSFTPARTVGSSKDQPDDPELEETRASQYLSNFSMVSSSFSSFFLDPPPPPFFYYSYFTDLLFFFFLLVLRLLLLLILVP